MFVFIKALNMLLKSLFSISWSILDFRTNPLRHLPVESKFLFSILLSCFWCLAFGIYTAELLLIGYNMIGHIAVISMAFVTWFVFQNVKKTYAPTLFATNHKYPLMRDPDGAPKCYEMTDEETLNAVKRSDDLLKPTKNQAKQ
jgi:hypothetical protein